MLTAIHLRLVMPRCQDIENTCNSLNAVFDKFDMSSKFRKAGFLSQIAHESNELNVLEENLNYKATSLLRVFPKYFSTIDIANKYHRRPEAIANHIYANRMGNGPEDSGDGWKYRGRGPIQNTGYNNYVRLSNQLGIDLISEPELLATMDVGLMAAGFYWQDANLAKYADVQDIDGISDLVNKGRKTEAYGDTHGFLERKAYWDKALSVFDANYIP